MASNNSTNTSAHHRTHCPISWKNKIPYQEKKAKKCNLYHWNIIHFHNNTQNLRTSSFLIIYIFTPSFSIIFFLGIINRGKIELTQEELGD